MGHLNGLKSLSNLIGHRCKASCLLWIEKPFCFVTLVGSLTMVGRNGLLSGVS